MQCDDAEGNTEVALRWNENESFAFACSTNLLLKYINLNIQYFYSQGKQMSLLLNF